MVQSADSSNSEAPYDVLSTTESSATTLLSSPTATTETMLSSTEIIVSSIETTPAAVSPTTAPYKPDDKGETNVFNVTDSKGKICILFKALMKFKFAYKKADDPVSLKASIMLTLALTFPIKWNFSLHKIFITI